ncbi:hypothetical protein COB21_02570 [Candidatus Aerophobetes bacterium]|uniref:Carbohydrate-binding domain-containing protein n=1 Tax=Aerophobetes bacterium TaxID=2030807 RepID=A0A2A4X5I0_UNCAE|nr:MAG: hypothetical protein COB21_02570 [Candidatus Aerophobetes bacterium]
MKWNQDTSIAPLDCFAFDFVKKRSKAAAPLKAEKAQVLPSMDVFEKEKDFAKLWWSVSSDGIRVLIDVDKPLEKVFFPHQERGDSVELFIDTRDNKNSKVVTQYCHHFVILPEEKEEKSVFEVTRFHVYHTREFVDTSLSELKKEIKKKRYKLSLFLPKQMLFGFDLENYTRIGFTYRINGFNKEPQHFVLSGEKYNIAAHPHLWGSFLIK